MSASYTSLFTMKIERVKFRNFHIVFKSRFFFHELYSLWWSGGGKEEGGAIVNGTEKEEAKAAPRTTQGQEAFPRGQGWKKEGSGCGKVYLWFAFSEPRVFLHGRRNRGDFLDGSLLCSPLFLYLLLRGSLSASSGGFTTQSLAPWTYWHSATHPWQNQTSVNLPIFGLR